MWMYLFPLKLHFNGQIPRSEKAQDSMIKISTGCFKDKSFALSVMDNATLNYVSEVL